MSPPGTEKLWTEVVWGGVVGAVEAVWAKEQIRQVLGQVTGQLQLPGARGAWKAAPWEAEGGGAGGPVGVTGARKRAWHREPHAVWAPGALSFLQGVGEVGRLCSRWGLERRWGPAGQHCLGSEADWRGGRGTVSCRVPVFRGQAEGEQETQAGGALARPWEACRRAGWRAGRAPSRARWRRAWPRPPAGATAAGFLVQLVSVCEAPAACRARATEPCGGSSGHVHAHPPPTSLEQAHGPRSGRGNVRPRRSKDPG